MIGKCDMFKALVEGRLDDLAAMLRAGADVNIVADSDTSLIDPSNIAQGDTLVHVALHKGNEDAFELLLRFRANLNVGAADGVTPLQVAVNKGLDHIALWLIDNGANFNTMDRFGLTPLHYTDNCDILTRILGKGVAVDLKAHSTGYTPLHYAAYHNRAAKAQLLLSHGADPRACGGIGETPLHLLMALKYGDVAECATILLDAGADIDTQDKNGNTPLHWALGAHASQDWMAIGNPKGVRFLLKRRANVKLKNRQGMTPVVMAWRCADLEYRKPFRELSIKPTIGDRLRAFL